MALHGWGLERARRAVMLGGMLVVGMASVAGAQQVAVGAGTVVGTVTDPAGKLVQRARVTLTPDLGAAGMGTAVVVSTDDEGAFAFAAVPAGKFVVAVTAEGFQPATVDGAVAAGRGLSWRRSCCRWAWRPR